MRNDKLAYSVTEAAQLLGISRNHAYLMVHSGVIPSRRIGDRRILIPRRALEEFLSRGDEACTHAKEQLS